MNNSFNPQDFPTEITELHIPTHMTNVYPTPIKPEMINNNILTVNTQTPSSQNTSNIIEPKQANSTSHLSKSLSTLFENDPEDDLTPPQK